jgi:hypothetical protein
MSLILTTNFNGSEAGQIFSDVFATGVMFDANNATQLYNVSNKVSVSLLSDATSGIVPYSCDFVEGDITLSDRTLNPEKFMFTKSFCKSQMWDMWVSFVRTNNQTPNPLEQLDVNNVSDFTTYLLNHYGKLVSARIDEILWKSTAANPVVDLAIISGLREKMLADATVIDVPGAVAITSATAKAAFENTLTLVPASVLAQPDFAFYVNQKTLTAYLLSLTAVGVYGNVANSTITPTFLGYRIVVSNGIPDNTIVATYSSNLFVATNINAVDINVFDKSIVGEDKIGMRGQWVMDANYGFGKNIVLYTV